MPPSPSKPPLAEALRESVSYAVRAREHLRAGLSDARIASLTPPPAEQHLRRFFFGLALPLTLIRIAWGNVPVRASMRRRLLPSLFLVALVAAAGVVDILHAVAAAPHDAASLAREGADDDDDDVHATAAAGGIADGFTVEKRSGGAVASLVVEGERGAAEAEKAHAEAAQHKAQAAPPSGRVAVMRAVFHFLTSKVAKLLATLGVVQWILIWIGREHFDQTSYDLALLSGVPGEPLPGPPRLRFFDFAFLKTKLWRAVRSILFLMLAGPVAWIAGMVPHVGSVLAVTVEAAWAAYWGCAFAIANSPFVWEPAADGERAPWFVRALRSAAEVPLLGVPFALYARLLTRATRNVWPACLAFERAPWESAGLALARALASVPGISLVARPAFVPAATHAFLARREEREP